MKLVLVDTSALVDVFVTSPNTQSIRAWLKQRRPVVSVSDFAVGEFAAAISRLHRLGHMTENDARRTLAVFDAWREAQCTAIATEPSDIRVAASFVRRFETKLALPDAIHLAVASRLGSALVSFDQRQVEAAGMLGIAVEAVDQATER
jgi:uncharacterized protein